MFGYIEPFYEPAAAEIEPGHIWCDQPIYLPPRHGLKIDRVNPQDDRELEFRVSGRTADTFQHAPVHSLKLQASEAAVLAKTKKDRPVVILGGKSACELKPPQQTRVADVVMVLPLYRFERYDEHTRKRASYYEFDNVFYLPSHDQPRFDEGFARLDQVQPVAQGLLTRHRGLKLSADALDALLEWFVHYTTGRGPDDSLILEYRRDMLAANGQ